MNKGLYECILLDIIILQISKSFISIKQFQDELANGKATYLEKLLSALETNNFLIFSNIA